ncbi:MAG: DNA replication/repair protein RecF [Gammaproteobacteria bacterium]|nr:DNA replication/repair protein RecF [Gammaproteobacteria bacterium]
MTIRQLSLTDFRNLASTTLDFHPRLNLVYGENGSGKTSLLEAIHVTCQARSFRSHQLRPCVRHDQPGFLLFARFGQFKAGIGNVGKKLQIRIDGENVARRSELVRLAPINLVNADTFRLIDGSPQQRRRFLDWCLFHVEHEYTEHWIKYQHALRQRNRLLKSRRDLQLLDYWDQHLSQPAEIIAGMRRKYCDRIVELLQGELAHLVDDLCIELSYQGSWDPGQGLAARLEALRQKDIKLGYTSAGLHRDDIHLTTNGRNCAEMLSRGQSKRLCVALVVAVLDIVGRCGSEPIILLIDDLGSELDQSAQNRVYKILAEMNLQLFISNISDTVPGVFETKEFKLFHVEHGIIRPRFSS